MRLAVPMLASLLALGLMTALGAAQAAQPNAALPTSSAACPTYHRLSMTERFETANTSHDGRLTLDQAKASKEMRGVARNFEAIDATHKGYVTEDDIKAWYKARRAAYKARRAAEGQPAKS